LWSFYLENRTNKIDKWGNPDGFNKLNLS